MSVTTVTTVTTQNTRDPVIRVKNAVVSDLRRLRKEFFIYRESQNLPIDKETMCTKREWSYRNRQFKIRRCDFDYDLNHGIIRIVDN